MKLFLFDFDGVLVDSLEVYEKTVKTTFKKLNNLLYKAGRNFWNSLKTISIPR